MSQEKIKWEARLDFRDGCPGLRGFTMNTVYNNNFSNKKLKPDLHQGRFIVWNLIFFSKRLKFTNRKDDNEIKKVSPNLPPAPHR